MAFEPGHKLSKGRPKGAVNTATVEIRNKLKDANFDPIKEFLARFSAITDDARACDALLKFMKFVYPTLANVEATVEDTTDPAQKPQPLTPENLVAMLKAARGGK